MGYIATVGDSKNLPCEQADERVYCVKEEYTEKGTDQDWKKVYSGRGSMGGDWVTLYEAIPENSTKLVSVRGFGLANGENQPMDEPPRLLRADMVSIIHEKPIARIEVLDIDYDKGNMDIRSSVPTSFAATRFRNCNHKEQGLSQTVSLTDTISESFSWEVSVMVGVSVTKTVGPDISQLSATASLEVTTSFGGTETQETSTDNGFEMKIVVPPM